MPEDDSQESKHVARITIYIVLTEIDCRFTIIDYTTQSYLSLKCVYLFLADPVYKMQRLDVSGALDQYNGRQAPKV